MTYIPYITNSLDHQLLSIQNLKYLPWIGNKALNQETKTLIIGESVYNWEKELEARKKAQIRIEQNDFARVVIYEHGIVRSHGKSKFFAKNIEKLNGVNASDRDTRTLFWEQMFFHELVQRPLSSRKDRPTSNDYEIGAQVLTDLLKILKPQKCIFLGSAWDKYEPLRDNLKKLYTISEKHFEKRNNANPKIITISELGTKIYFIKHPSLAFKVSDWKDFMQNN